MQYVITVVAVLLISFFAGFVLGAIADDEDLEERAREDHDQMEFLRMWWESRKRS